MSKTKTSFFCRSCGSEYSKWMGKCSACGEWNTITEEVIKIDQAAPMWSKQKGDIQSRKPQLIHQITSSAEDRIDMQNQELNRVLGGGLVRGSLVLIGGEPGIGKSTLLLQVALKVKNIRILYVSGEESEMQIKMRAERVGIENDQCYILNETRIDEIFVHLANIAFDILIIDSIQTLQTSKVDSTAGSVSQIKECAGELQRFAKESQTPVFIVGHITKDGSIAGPKILEHMVDTVLQFEGDRNYGYRILRSHKNRFGSTSEIGIYEMQSNGMREVKNPSEILITQRDEQSTGVAIAATMEGGRPILIEVQALVSSAVYGMPQRSATGFDTRRLNMLLAVLEKRAGFKLASKDVFLNIAGGIKVDDPAIDLAVISAILSSNYEIPIPDKVCFAAEIGLTGEVRTVNHAEQRIREAEKLGFDKIYISKFSLKGIEKSNYKIEIHGYSRLEQVFKAIFAEKK